MVLDASMALAWIYSRTKESETKLAEEALKAFAKTTVWVPNLWYAEVTNALLIGERRGVITEAQASNYLTKLMALPLNVDDSPATDYYHRIITLARQYKLTSYDATYLDLSLRLGAVLATFDRQLAEAMHLAGGNTLI